MDGERLHRFFTDLFGQAMEDTGGLLTIWTLKYKASAHFSDIGKAVNHVQQAMDSTDVYFGTTLRRNGLKKAERGGVKDCIAFVGLWADIDFYVPGVHADQNLPPDTAAATEILKLMGRQASFTWFTGNGVQAFWRVNEAIDISDDGERTRAAALSSAWERTLVARSRQAGFSFDVGNHNLDRILRVPMTLNFKRDEPVKGTMLVEHDSVWAVDDLESVLVTESASPDDSLPKTYEQQLAYLTEHGGKFHVRRDAKTPDKFEGCSDADEKLKATWEMKRKFKSGDDSCSVYCMSLAAQCVQIKWSNQDIADLLCSFMRRWAKLRDLAWDPNKHQFRWFVLTLHKCRAEKVEKSDLQEAAEEMESQAAAVGPQTDRVRFVREKLGVPFVRIEQHGRVNVVAGDVTFFMVLTDEADSEIKVPIGSMGCIHDRKILRNCIETVTGFKVLLKVEHITARKWERQMVPVLARCVEVVEDGRPIDTISGWLQEYLSATPPETDKDSLMDARRGRRPYLSEGELWLSPVHFGSYVRDVLGSRDIRPAQLRKILKLAGFKRRVVSTGPTSRAYWGTPIDGLDMQIGTETEPTTKGPY